MSVNPNAGQPWIDKASAMTSYMYFININADIAAGKGLTAGDTVGIETWRALRVRGPLQVRKGEHTETTTIMSRAGHWAGGPCVGRGNGVNFNSFIDLRFSDPDPIWATPDPLARVRVAKAGYVDVTRGHLIVRPRKGVRHEF